MSIRFVSFATLSALCLASSATPVFAAPPANDLGLNIVPKMQYALHMTRYSCTGASYGTDENPDPNVWPIWRFDVFTNNEVFYEDATSNIVAATLYETTGGSYTTPTKGGMAPSTVYGPALTTGGRATFERAAYVPTRITFANHLGRIDGSVDESKAEVVEIKFGEAQALNQASDVMFQTNILRGTGERYTLDVVTGVKTTTGSWNVICVD